MKVASCLFGFCLFYIIALALAQPVPPKTWPPVWYTWVVTSVVKVGVDKPLYDIGQLIAFDSINNYTCRYLQQNLLTPNSMRPIDVCDYVGGSHYMMSDVIANSTCGGTTPIQGTLSPIAYPAEYLAAAQFMGVNKVAQKDCNHFVAMNIVVGGETVQMDVWTAVDTSFPCQISVTDMSTNVITTWAFDGFAGFIPPAAVAQCSVAKLMCAEEKWVCNVIAGTDQAKLSSAIGWVCDPTNLDCSPINPGGAHYFPNTLVDHCNWAFNAYYRIHRSTQGLSACDFGGIAHLVPPTNSTLSTVKPMQLSAVFSNDLVCERS